MKVVLLLVTLAVGAYAESGPMPAVGVTAEDDLALNTKQKADFELFKAAVLPKITCPTMKKDIYLVKFFKNAAMILDAAKTQFDEALELRKTNNINKIMEIDFVKNGGFSKFKASTSEVDRKGRPIMYLNIGGWNLKAAMNKGEDSLYESTMYRLMEASVLATIKAYEAGKENARLDVIINYDGWTAGETGLDCPDCGPFMVKIATNVIKMWPNWFHKIALVNTSPDFSAFLSLIGVALPEALKKDIFTFDDKEAEWRPKIETMIDEKILNNLVQKKGEKKEDFLELF